MSDPSTSIAYRVAHVSRQRRVRRDDKQRPLMPEMPTARHISDIDMANYFAHVSVRDFARAYRQGKFSMMEHAVTFARESSGALLTYALVNLREVRDLFDALIVATIVGASGDEENIKRVRILMSCYRSEISRVNIMVVVQWLLLIIIRGHPSDAAAVREIIDAFMCAVLRVHPEDVHCGNTRSLAEACSAPHSALLSALSLRSTPEMRARPAYAVATDLLGQLAVREIVGN